MRYALESRHPDFPAGRANGTSGSICPSLCFVSFCFVRLCEVTVHFSVPLLWWEAASLPTSYQDYMRYNPVFSHTKQVWSKGTPKRCLLTHRVVIREVANLIHNNMFILQWPEELTFTEAYICSLFNWWLPATSKLLLPNKVFLSWFRLLLVTNMTNMEPPFWLNS